MKKTLYTTLALLALVSTTASYASEVVAPNGGEVNALQALVVGATLSEAKAIAVEPKISPKSTEECGSIIAGIEHMAIHAKDAVKSAATSVASEAEKIEGVVADKVHAITKTTSEEMAHAEQAAFDDAMLVRTELTRTASSAEAFFSEVANNVKVEVNQAISTIAEEEKKAEAIIAEEAKKAEAIVTNTVTKIEALEESSDSEKEDKAASK